MLYYFLAWWLNLFKHLFFVQTAFLTLFECLNSAITDQFLGQVPPCSMPVYKKVGFNLCPGEEIKWVNTDTGRKIIYKSFYLIYNVPFTFNIIMNLFKMPTGRGAQR